jgi:hypothetical protein
MIQETRKVRAVKVELLIINFDECSDDEIKSVIENARYPNHCISPYVKKVESVVLDWSDEHPLNRRSTCDAEYARLFPA